MTVLRMIMPASAISPSSATKPNGRFEASSAPVAPSLLVATVLTLLVVPALYALWFRVRQDEPDRTAVIAEALAEHDDMEPIRIAAE